MQPRADDIRDLPLFADLDSEEVDWIALRLDDRHVEAGQSLTLESASGYEFFVILDGTATVTKGGDAIATLGRGDFFGEAAVLGSSGRRNASVAAATPMRVAAMFGTNFRLLEQRQPQLAARIRDVMTMRAATS